MRVSRLLKRWEYQGQHGYTFRCPGCNSWHNVKTSENGWGFNGDVEKPTFTPSILVTHEAKPDAAEEFKEWREKRVCHSFVTGGRIQFLGDCTHELAFQTVDIPDWDTVC